jgi:hypothetical protein
MRHLEMRLRTNRVRHRHRRLFEQPAVRCRAVRGTNRAPRTRHRASRSIRGARRLDVEARRILAGRFSYAAILGGDDRPKRRRPPLFGVPGAGAAGLREVGDKLGPQSIGAFMMPTDRGGLSDSYKASVLRARAPRSARGRGAPGVRRGSKHCCWTRVDTRPFDLFRRMARRRNDPKGPPGVQKGWEACGDA